MAEEGQQDQNPTGNTEQGGGDAKWYDSLPDDLKGNETLKGFDGVESLAKAHLTTQAQLAELQAKVPVVHGQHRGEGNRCSGGLETGRNECGGCV